MKIRALIVDDEMLARLKIRRMLELEPDFELTGECESGQEAIASIREHHPDLVFLDIQMPEMDGFDVLNALPPNERPATIFITAYDRHALSAFDVHALDYLLKPFKASRFQEALQRARDHFRSQHLQDAAAPWRDNAGLGVIAVKSGTRTVFVNIEDLDYIEAAANYAILHVGTESHILRETLTNLSNKLPANRFLRVNRSAIVNLGFVSEIRRLDRRSRVVVLKNKKEIEATCGIREITRRFEEPAEGDARQNSSQDSPHSSQSPQQNTRAGVRE